jgi:hypothetical protein
MRNAMAKLLKLGDQATLGFLDATNLYSMRYLTMTDDSKLLEKMLEKELPSQQNLIDIVRRFENASRIQKTLSTASASAVEEEAEANFVGKGWGRGRGRQDQDQGKAGKKELVRPNLPYTEEQAQIILAWYRTRFLCCKCGGKRNPKEIHSCPAQKAMCNKCKQTGHYEAHCFAKWKSPNEKAVSQSVIQTGDSGDYSDAESDTSYATAASSRLWLSKNTPTPSVILYFKANNSEGDYHHCTALPDTGTSRSIILKKLLDNEKIAYDPGGKENIIAANSSSLGCVGNVILDIHIDNGKKSKIDALVVSHLSSNCLKAWKDMQIADIPCKRTQNKNAR